MTLGKYLKQKRFVSGHTQKTVAKAIGYLSAQYISNVERDICPPSDRMLLKMAKLYSLNKDELLAFLVTRETDRLKTILKLK